MTYNVCQVNALVIVVLIKLFNSIKASSTFVAVRPVAVVVDTSAAAPDVATAARLLIALIASAALVSAICKRVSKLFKILL